MWKFNNLTASLYGKRDLTAKTFDVLYDVSGSPVGEVCAIQTWSTSGTTTFTKPWVVRAVSAGALRHVLTPEAHVRFGRQRVLR